MQENFIWFACQLISPKAQKTIIRLRIEITFFEKKGLVSIFSRIFGVIELHLCPTRRVHG